MRKFSESSIFGTQFSSSCAIIENIDRMHKAGLASLGFYFFDFRETEKKHRRRLLSSLLWQLSGQSNAYRDILSHLYSAHRDDEQSPHDKVLAECLTNILRCQGQAPVYLILDAVDECPITCDTQTPRQNVLSIVKDLVDLRLPNLRICLTSRPEVDIKYILDPFCSISLHDQDGQKQDILDYINSVVHSDETMREWSTEEKEHAIEVLSKRANGMCVTDTTMLYEAC